MSDSLFAKITPYAREWLAVDEIHQLYVEQSGSPSGIPAVFLHGGPGYGTSENQRRYFDPQKYRIIVIDQRGCGQSLPSPSIKNNTTPELINDLEKVRKYLGVKQWLICAEGWGTTLALAYGIEHKEHILSFILSGVFLGTQEELRWQYCQGGVERFYPEQYQMLLSSLKLAKTDNLIKAYDHIVNGDDEIAAISACKFWYDWRQRISTVGKLDGECTSNQKTQSLHKAICFAKISCYYFTNHCFLSKAPLSDYLSVLGDIPAIVLHGRLDMVSQVAVARNMLSKWPNATLQILPSNGHSCLDAQMRNAICHATDSMATFLNEKHD